MKECVDNLNQEDEEEKLVSSLWGSERCLRVLESVSGTQTHRHSHIYVYVSRERVSETLMEHVCAYACV